MTKPQSHGYQWRCRLCPHGHGTALYSETALRELQRHYQARHAPKRNEATR